MPRVAFFPDSFHESNGVARTSRALSAVAAARGQPFLCINAGPRTRWVEEGPAARLEIARGPMSFALEHDLRHDLLLWRHVTRVANTVRAFGAEVVHVTGPSDVGQLGAYVAHRLGLPLVASWHTNLHEYAACRIQKRLERLPLAGQQQIDAWVRRGTWRAALQFYRLASVLMAPNPELVDLLHHETGKPTYLMRRGVDTTLFSPAKRDVDDGCFRFGFVGRLSSEKNVRLLPWIERALVAAGHRRFRFLIVGEGQERAWLQAHLHHADFAGVLHGEALARAYANMDVLIFPSETDTFGNVVQEAFASGTPAVVSSRGGPKFIVRPDVSGIVAPDDAAFVAAAESILIDPDRLRRMREAARRQALEASWETVFDAVSEAYAVAVKKVPSGPAKQSATVNEVCVNLARHPVQCLVHRWNWKAAALSALLRGGIFFTSNLAAGPGAAVRALIVDVMFRVPLAGAFAAAAQAFTRAEPPWAASLAVVVLLPALAHVVEVLIHWTAGTPELGTSVLASIALSLFSAAFNLFAMRRGALIVGGPAGAFREDLRRLPRLFVDFVLLAPRAMARASRHTPPVTPHGPGHEAVRR